MTTPTNTPKTSAPADLQDLYHYILAAKTDGCVETSTHWHETTFTDRCSKRGTVKDRKVFAVQARAMAKTRGLVLRAVPSTRDALDAWAVESEAIVWAYADGRGFNPYTGEKVPTVSKTSKTSAILLPLASELSPSDYLSPANTEHRVRFGSDGNGIFAAVNLSGPGHSPVWSIFNSVSWPSFPMDSHIRAGRFTEMDIMAVTRWLGGDASLDSSSPVYIFRSPRTLLTKEGR